MYNTITQYLLFTDALTVHVYILLHLPLNMVEIYLKKSKLSLSILFSKSFLFQLLVRTIDKNHFYMGLLAYSLPIGNFVYYTLRSATQMHPPPPVTLVPPAWPAALSARRTIDRPRAGRSTKICRHSSNASLSITLNFLKFLARAALAR